MEINININIPKLSREKCIKYGAVVVITVVMMVVAGILLGPGYKTPINKSIALINKKTEDSMEYRKYSGLDTQHSFEVMHSEAISKDGDTYEDYVKALENEFGDNYKIKYSIDSADKYNDKKLEELADEITVIYESEISSADESLALYEEEWQDEEVSFKQQEKLKKVYEKYIDECGKIKVTAAYEVDVVCTIKGSSGKETFDIKALVIAKVNGKWIFVDGLINPYIVYSNVSR